MSGAVGYWARAWLRRNRRSVVLLALAMVVTVGGAMGAAAGARRTATAGERLFAVSNVPEVFVFAQDPETLERMITLPQVDGAQSLRQLGLHPASVPCDDGEGNYFPAVVQTTGAPFSVPRARLLQGRLADPSAADEVVLSASHARRLGVGAGDSLGFVPFLFDDGEPIGCNEEVVIEVEVVGVVRELFEVGAPDETVLSNTYFTPAFLDAHPEAPDLSEAMGSYVAFATLAPGIDDEAYLAEVEARAPRGEDGASAAGALPLPFGDPVTPTLRATAVGLWGLAGVVAAVGLVTMAVGLARQAAAAHEELRLLSALGLERRWLAVSAAIPGAAALAVAVPVALAMAAACSTVHLIGVAAVAEPNPGFDLDPLVLGLGGAALLTVGGSLVAATSWRAAGTAARPGETATGRRLGLGNVLAGTGVPPWAGMGAQYALGGSRPNVPSRFALSGVVLGTGAVLAVLIFGVGVERASTEPSVYGWGDWDGFASAGSDDPGADEQARSALLDHPDLEAAAALEFRFKLRIDGELVSGITVRHLRGRSGPTVVEGRLPVGTGEIALGADVLELLGVGAGDRVVVEGPDGEREDVEVVGVFALPSIDGDGIASGWTADRALVDALGWPEGCNDEAECYHTTAIALRRGADAPAVLARLRAAGLEVDLPAPAPEVLLLREVEDLPRVAALVAAGVAGIGLAHTLAVTAARRRRDLGVVQAIGFVRGQVRRVLYAQGVVLGVAGAVVGGVIGAVVGRVAWQRMARALGLGPELPHLTSTTVAVSLGALALAFVLSIPAGWRAARVGAAARLRSE